MSDFREMRALYLYGAIKACHITVRYIPIEKAINSLLCWRRQHPRQTFASSLLSGDSVVLVSVQQVLKKSREDSQTTSDSTTTRLSLHCGSRAAPKAICLFINLENTNKVNSFKNATHISDVFIVTENLISLGLSIFENFHDGASLMGYALCGKVKGCLTLHAERHWPFLHTLHRNVKSNPALRSVRTFINTLQGF